MMLLAILHKLRLWHRKRRYRPGKIITRFVARDIRRDVEVVDASQIERGVIRARTRTWNLLYAAHGVSSKPPFGDVRMIMLRDLWKWSGESWGGPVSTSEDGLMPSKPLGELISVLTEARTLLTLPTNDFSWSSWEGEEASTKEIDALIHSLQAGRLPPRPDLDVLFVVTGPIQEVSLSSGWGWEFIALAERFDRACDSAYDRPNAG